MSRKTLIRDERGLASLEFALLAPVLFLVLLGVIDFARTVSARSRLERETARAARLVAATNCPKERPAMLAAAIKTSMKDYLGSGAAPKLESKAYKDRFGDVGEPEPFVDDPIAPNGQFDVGETFTDVNGNGQWDRDMGLTDSIGEAGQVVSYTATIAIEPLFPFLAEQITGRATYEIRAATLVRNEPIFRSVGCSK